MKYANTTPLQIGMTGEFLGKRYRIAGRSVMGMDEGGETYTWNEFNLVAADGSHATLVHEITERSVEWRMFSLIEPTNPITAAYAATFRIGDSINVTGQQMRVTCVDESRVLYIEGEAPEGEDVGDVAHYFNAEHGSEMIVVSWTGDEVECYRGVTLPPHVVTNAFGISNVPVGSLSQFRGGSGSKFNAKLVVAVAALLITLTGIWFLQRINWNSSAPSKIGKAKLTVGKSGHLNGTQYRIIGRATIELAHVGKRILRHEYVLSNDTSETLLAQGSEQNSDEWILLTPVQPPRQLTAQQLAALRLGDAMEFDGTFAHVREMCLSRVQSVEGTTPFIADTPLYGLIARSPAETFVVRWNETTVIFYRETRLSMKSVLAAFR